MQPPQMPSAARSGQRFQSLIGRLATRLLIADPADPAAFQSLIGRLATGPRWIEGTGPRAFQSLIGRLATT